MAAVADLSREPRHAYLRRGQDPERIGLVGALLGRLQALPQPDVLLDEQRRHVEVNGAYLELLGYSRQSLVGRPIYEIVVAGPVMPTRQWSALLGQRQFIGEPSSGARTAAAPRFSSQATRRSSPGSGWSCSSRSEPPAACVDSIPRRRARAQPGSLSGRELEVIELVADGLSGTRDRGGAPAHA